MAGVNADPHGTVPSASHPVVLDDVSVVRRLGRGAFGAVFLVRLPHSSQLCALKRVPKNRLKLNRPILGSNQPQGTSPDKKLQDRIEQKIRKKAFSEKRVLKMVNGYHFLPSFIFTAQTLDSFLFATDYCKKGPLVTFLSSLPRTLRVTESDVKFLAAELVCAIGILHSMRIIHKDIKCGNILLDRDGHIVVCDFGLSTVLPPGKDSVTKNREGTKGLVAPEITTGAEYGVCSDWYSTGCTIKSILCQYPARRASFSRTSPEFQDLVQGLVQPDPKRRLGGQGVRQVQGHLFFRDIDWSAAKDRRLPVPPLLTISFSRRTVATTRLPWDLRKPTKITTALEDFSDYEGVTMRKKENSTAVEKPYASSKCSTHTIPIVTQTKPAAGLHRKKKSVTFTVTPKKPFLSVKRKTTRQ